MDRTTFDRGYEIRGQVLGREHVENAFNTADELTAPLQELVTQYCTGAVWGREGLSRKTRSMLNLTMLSALNRPHENEIHVRGAINNGLTREEIREFFMQVASYCGVPAAVGSFRIAPRVSAEMDAKS